VQFDLDIRSTAGELTEDLADDRGGGGDEGDVQAAGLAAAARRSRRFRALGPNAAPASVRWTLREVRRNNSTPTIFSSCLICWDRAG
jgi:hypothetical protein